MIIADDDARFRSRLSTSLRGHGGVVPCEVRDAESAVRAVGETAAPVLILSLDMPGLAGVDAIRRVVAYAPTTRVLAVTSSADPYRLVEAIRAGASGYLLKRSGESGLAHIRVALALLAGMPSATREAASPCSAS